ncbi:hypothetical protein [Parasegetibacter sp. NRK P23]|uniref:hypothetical protein n=1 Tax=Parasegetibacter sp. NRK P23 TaxID=2942999 RepID=UPI00204441D0|nr:hypothetical protein [Parasegetibacter sp. NRK P23]MCM5529772.1 hypothetical protein [Parasegetibacter sp. NRK P23]
MFTYILAILLSLCAGQHTTPVNGGDNTPITTMDDDGGGGEAGHAPNQPPPPKPIKP